MMTRLFAAITTLSLGGVGTTLADNSDTPAPAGYAFPSFWAEAPTQQTLQSTNQGHTAGPSIGTFSALSEPANHRGTFLFPPNPYGG